MNRLIQEAIKKLDKMAGKPTPKSEDDWQEESTEELVQHKLFSVPDYAYEGQPYPGAINEAVENHPDDPQRLVFKHDDVAPTAKKRSISVPKHMWYGGKNSQGGTLHGMEHINKLRAQVYGSDHRPPLSISEIEKIHREHLEDHFSKPVHEQIKAEREATEKLKQAGHLGKSGQSGLTTDKGEKTDTVNHEFDEKGRRFRARSMKGVAGHAVYTSGAGKDAKHHIINTCPGQTAGCGGGVDEKGQVDASKGTCFAPKAESQYTGAAVRRAAHEQAKHDPAMTKDWILAHTGSIRKEVGAADKKNERLLIRPNVVDETDRSTRHVLKHLNKQREAENKPPIIANSYGKTDELHDPENHYHVTFSNIGPKVKMHQNPAAHGSNRSPYGEIPQNAARDATRVQQTITATRGGAGKVNNWKPADITNDEGKQTPPKNSYMVINAKRGSDMQRDFEKHITHIKYWSAGRPVDKLAPHETAQGEHGHYDGKGIPTTEDKAHYGHTTIRGEDGVSRRYDYQRQHVLHPRLVPVKVGKNKDGTDEIHHIPTDSRFRDNDYLPKAEKRFKSPNGKVAGAVLVTTPTLSTTNDQHHSIFTHEVNHDTIEHAKANNGEYEIDHPHKQELARGTPYVAPGAEIPKSIPKGVQVTVNKKPVRVIKEESTFFRKLQEIRGK